MTEILKKILNLKVQECFNLSLDNDYDEEEEFQIDSETVLVRFNNGLAVGVFCLNKSMRWYDADLIGGEGVPKEDLKLIDVIFRLPEYEIEFCNYDLGVLYGSGRLEDIIDVKILEELI
jgi:hypothetical protein